MQAANKLTVNLTTIFVALAASVALAGHAVAKPFVPHERTAPPPPPSAAPQVVPKADPATPGAEAKPEAKYACPMGDYRGDQAGKCPICGMTLQPIGAKAAASTEPAGDPYYLSTSPTGKPLGDKPVVYYYQQRQLRFADAADLAAFKASPAKYIAAVDKQMTADQIPFYALKSCPVTDQSLSGMGGPVDFIYRNRLVRFCCGGCVGEFTAHPAQYLKKLDAAAISAQKGSYPLDHCLVMPDEKISATDPDQRDIVVAGRLFRLCDSDCAADVRADPAKWLSALEAAKKAKP